MTGLSIDDLRPMLGEVVDLLPPIEAEILTALYWERLSLREVGERMGIQKAKVYDIRNRAFRRIKGLVDDDE